MAPETPGWAHHEIEDPEQTQDHIAALERELAGPSAAANEDRKAAIDAEIARVRGTGAKQTRPRGGSA